MTQKGFTLVELAIVTIIIGLMLSGILLSVSANRDLNDSTETQKTLGTAMESLFGFAATHGRLPCPATATSSGRESYCTSAAPAPCGAELFTPQTHGRCSAPFTGFLPAATLGVSPVDNAGYAIDAWRNRIRYAVTTGNNNAFTALPTAPPPPTPGTGIRSVWAVDPTTLAPDLKVCSTSAISNAGTPTADCTNATERMTDNAVALVFSTGKNGGIVPAGADELANWTSSDDRVFVHHVPTLNFDDQVAWMSGHVLYNKLIAAGRLP